MHLYQQLPHPPNKISSANILSRIIDGLGFRYRLATEGLDNDQATFRPIEGSMNIEEVNTHIYRLVHWSFQAFQPSLPINKSLQTFEAYRTATLELCEQFSQHISEMTTEEIEAVKVYLKRTDTHYPFWYLINGPIEDALTHVGQINTWRRMAGNPCPRISPFTGEVY